MHGPHPPGFPHAVDPARCLWDAQHAQEQMAIQGMLAARALASSPSAPAAGGHALGLSAHAAPALCIDCRRTMKAIDALSSGRLRDIERRYADAQSRVDPLVAGLHRKALGATLDDFEASLTRRRQYRLDVLDPIAAEMAVVEEQLEHLRRQVTVHDCRQSG